MSKEISNPKRIQGTNDNSILSKCSMIKYGYFDDKYLNCMISKFARRTPLINRGYYIRMKAINYILNQFINSLNGCKFQIVSLGAGFDTSFFRLTEQKLLENCEFYEVDYPKVVQRKAKLIKDEPELYNLINDFKSDLVYYEEHIVINTSNYKLIGCDMTQINVFDACLRHCKISFDLPTLFLSECVITYIGVKKTRNLLNYISQSFSNNSFVLYEQIYPNDYFGQFMCQHFKNLGSSLRGISTYQTKNDQYQRFIKAGWESIQICDMSEFYYQVLDRSERQRIEHLELFDEYEEWILKCQHYMILVANKGTIDFEFYRSHFDVEEEQNSRNNSSVETTLPMQLYKYDLNNLKMHYANAGIIVNDTEQFVVRIGGYGVDGLSSGHCKLSSVQIIATTTGQITTIVPDNSSLIVFNLCGSCLQMSNNEFLLFGGRTSPVKPNNNLTKLTVKFSDESWIALLQSEEYQGHCPDARWRHISIIYSYQDTKYMMCIGGRNEHGPMEISHTHILQLDPHGNGGQWVSYAINTNYEFPSSLVSGQLIDLGNGSVLLTGGLRNASLDLMDDTRYLWQHSTKQWTALHLDPVINRISSPVIYLPTQSPTEVSVVYVGGLSRNAFDYNTLLHVIFSVDSATDVVSIKYANLRSIIDTESNSNNIIMLHNHACVLTQTQLLFVIGGGGNCFSFGTHLNSQLIKIDLSTF